VDGSPVAIDILLGRARERNLRVDARVVDLEAGEFAVQPDTYHLVLSCYYLHRSLIPLMKSALVPGGLLIMIVHVADADQPRGTPTRAYPGELRAFFDGWRILHDREGEPGESAHRHAVAELVAQKPA
jgi:SAM-dependent methyltransferase